MKAFPTTIENEGYQIDHAGMNLRDYFAAKVLPALLFDLNAIKVDLSKTTDLAYAYADAMIKSREKNDS